jgi:hypothetical protein
MSSSDASLVASVNNATIELNRYLPLFIYITGIIGNILNVLVLSRRNLRSNPCAFTFLVSSIAGLIVIVSGLTTRLTAGWAVDLSETNTWLCKIRIVVLFVSRTIVVWLLAYTALNRWLSSSINVAHRNLSTLKNAQRGILLVIIFSFLLNGPLLYCYDANLIGTPARCYGFSVACRLYTDLSFTVGTIVIPSFFMLLFGLLMINNIRQLRKRVHIEDVIPVKSNNANNTHVAQQQQNKKINRSLLTMVLVQVIFLILCTAPYTIYKLYSTVTPIASSKPALQNAIEGLLFNLCTNLTYLATAMPFYIYTLFDGQIFRSALLSVMRDIHQKLTCS